MSAHEPQAAYDGPAVVVLDADPETRLEVEVRLRGAFSPLDGRFYWYGRVADTEPLTAVRGGTVVLLRTEHGEAPARLSDRDPWGRLRITGTGTPPF